MSPTQSNTVKGVLPFVAASDLRNLEGYLVKLTNNSGVPELARPAGLEDRVDYILEEGVNIGLQAVARPIESGQNVRIKALGTGVAGDLLTAADPSVAADAGKVITLPAAAATYRVVGVAEESFVAGQLVLMRPIASELVVVS
jgi:hypothetical protein